LDSQNNDIREFEAEEFLSMVNKCSITFLALDSKKSLNVSMKKNLKIMEGFCHAPL